MKFRLRLFQEIWLRRNNKGLGLIAVAVGIITIVVYLRALSCDFINLDDPTYVIENTGIRTLGKDFWFWSFCTIPLNYWTPLLWISFAIDYHFWGLNPFGYHLTNVLLHAGCAGLFVLLADTVYEQSGITRGRGTYRYWIMLLTAGLLFAIHPARVESVVWVTERKDVLNGIFTFGFLLFYLQYVSKKNNADRSRRKSLAYVLSLTLFTLSMLIKPSSFLLPLALLVVDCYPLGRFSREKWMPLLLEKLPFLFIGACIVLVSIIFRMNEGGFNSLSDFPMAVRTVAAGNSLYEYLKLLLFPVNILPFHILPRAVPISYIYKAVGVALCLVATILWRKRIPGLSASILFFVISILPSLHFMSDGYQMLLAPRYTYLPSILACILAAPAMISALEKIASLAGDFQVYVTYGLLATLFVFYGATTVILCNDWKNSSTFWTKVIEHQPFDKAYYFRGLYAAEKGDYPSAITDYSTCIQMATRYTLPDIHNVYAYRGYALAKTGYYQNALDDFTTAISYYPHQIYFYHRSKALQALGRQAEAKADLTKAGGVIGDLQWFQAN